MRADVTFHICALSLKERINRVSQYIHFGVILITVPNLIMIGMMILVFAAAVFISLPQEHAHQETTDQQSSES